MNERLPRLIIHYPDGVLDPELGIGRVNLGSKWGDRERTDPYYQEQFDSQGYGPVEGDRILMRDADGGLPDQVGVVQWTERTGWVLRVDPWDYGP